MHTWRASHGWSRSACSHRSEAGERLQLPVLVVYCCDGELPDTDYDNELPVGAGDGISNDR